MNSRSGRWWALTPMVMVVLAGCGSDVTAVDDCVGVDAPQCAPTVGDGGTKGDSDSTDTIDMGSGDHGGAVDAASGDLGDAGEDDTGLDSGMRDVGNGDDAGGDVSVPGDLDGGVDAELDYGHDAGSDDGSDDAGDMDSGVYDTTGWPMKRDVISDTASTGTPDSYFYDVDSGSPLSASIFGSGNGTWSVNIYGGNSNQLYPCSGQSLCQVMLRPEDDVVIVTAVTTDIGSYTLSIDYAGQGRR